MSSNFTPWERVEISRSPERPTSLDYISTIFDRYMSLHGDRLYGDDKAVVGGLASIGGRAVTVIGQQKGRSTKENIMRNFGMPLPGRISKISASDAPGRKIPQTDHSVCGYSGCFLRNRSRRAGSRRSNRKKYV